jgi:hypothetical protein
MKEITKENVTYEDLMNICVQINEFLESDNFDENENRNEIRKTLFSYEFSKFQSSEYEMNLYDYMTLSFPITNT